MRKSIYLLFVVLWSCTGNPGQAFNVKGDINNLGSNDLIYAKIVNGKPYYLDTINVENGKFNFNISDLNQDDFRFFIPINNKSKFIKVFVDNSDINISGDIDSLENIKISGSESHNLFEGLMNDYSTIDKQSRVLSLELRLANMEEDVDAISSLEEKFYASESEKPKLFIDFAKTHSNSNLSPWALYQISSYSDFNILKPIYDKFSEKVKQSYFSEDLKFILDEMSKTAIGAKAPEFTLPNTEGDNTSLSSFKGKLVLLDFWSPMCFYCRQENPHIVKLYEKYKGKDFEIIGINVEGKQDLDIWKLVIEEDKLIYPQLLDSIGIADVYKVKNTPYNVLIDANGIIVAKDLHEEALDNKLEELLK